MLHRVVDGRESAQMFSGVLARAIADGLAGAALLDRDGHVVARAGDLADDEAMPIASL
jgi:hypothetical protein